MTAPVVKAGLVFQHAKLLDPDWSPGPGERYSDAPPAVCRVTRVARGCVYYAVGRDSTRGRLVTTLDSFLAAGHGFDGHPPNHSNGGSRP